MVEGYKHGLNEFFRHPLPSSFSFWEHLLQALVLFCKMNHIQLQISYFSMNNFATFFKYALVAKVWLVLDELLAQKCLSSVS
jgi:hypothetical protein